MLSYCSANGRLHPSTAFCPGNFKSGLPGKNQTTKVLISKLLFCSWIHLRWPSLSDRSRGRHGSSAKAQESASGWPWPWAPTGPWSRANMPILQCVTCERWVTLASITDSPSENEDVAKWPSLCLGAAAGAQTGSPWRPNPPLIYNISVWTSPQTSHFQTAPVERANPHGRSRPAAGSASAQTALSIDPNRSCPHQAKCQHVPHVPQHPGAQQCLAPANEARTSGGRRDLCCADKATPFPAVAQARSGAIQGSLHGCCAVQRDCARRTTPELQPTASWWEITACRGVHMLTFYSFSNSLSFQTQCTATCLLTQRQGSPKSICRARTSKDLQEDKGVCQRIQEVILNSVQNPTLISRFLSAKPMDSSSLFYPTLHSP